MKVSEFHKKTIHLLYTEWVELFTWMQKVRYLLKNVASLYKSGHRLQKPSSSVELAVPAVTIPFTPGYSVL